MVGDYLSDLEEVFGPVAGYFDEAEGKFVFQLYRI
jgi:hypothetical protein